VAAENLPLPSVALSLQDGRLLMRNLGEFNVNWWGAGTGSARADRDIDVSAHFVAPGSAFELPAKTTRRLRSGQHVRFELYLSDASHKHYVARFDATLTVRNGSLVDFEAGEPRMTAGGW
jgi:hypothetical protein